MRRYQLTAGGQRGRATGDDMGNHSRYHVLNEVRVLRRFLRKPRTLEEVCDQYVWSASTAYRRMMACGDVYRVTAMAERTCRYVRILDWDRDERSITPGEAAQRVEENL